MEHLHKSKLTEVSFIENLNDIYSPFMNER